MILGDATRISSQWHDHLLARFDRFLVTGGLPAVVRAYATGEDHALVWRQIVADYEQDFIAIELARGGQPLAGWKRSSAGSEIDFIVKTGPATVPVECKASISVNLRHMRGLIAYLRSHGQRRGYVASLASLGESGAVVDMSCRAVIGFTQNKAMDEPLSLSASQPTHNFPFTREITNRSGRPSGARRLCVCSCARPRLRHPSVNYRATRHPAPPAPWPRTRRTDPEICVRRRCKLILKEPHYARGL